MGTARTAALSRGELLNKADSTTDKFKADANREAVIPKAMVVDVPKKPQMHMTISTVILEPLTCRADPRTVRAIAFSDQTTWPISVTGDSVIVSIPTNSSLFFIPSS